MYISSSWIVWRRNEFLILWSRRVTAACHWNCSFVSRWRCAVDSSGCLWWTGAGSKSVALPQMSNVCLALRQRQSPPSSLVCPGMPHSFSWGCSPSTWLCTQGARHHRLVEDLEQLPADVEGRRSSEKLQMALSLPAQGICVGSPVQFIICTPRYFRCAPPLHSPLLW